MDQKTIRILFALLRSAIGGAKLTSEERNEYSSELLQDLLKMASRHDVAHLLGLGLKKNGIAVSKENAEIEKGILMAVYRYEQLKYEFENLCSILEKARIPFLPLKGAVIRKYYPEAWMRTSCDVDILVHEEDLEKACSILVSENRYTYHQKGAHDIALFAPNKMHIELHYNLVEDGRANKSSEVLRNVWNVAGLRDGFSFCYEMSDEMYYFYHIAHMAKHFENGGCGIRPFMDLWILDNIIDANHDQRIELLKRGGLLKFAETAQRLSKVWFEEAEKDPISQQMEEYVLSGGAYGTGINRNVARRHKKGGLIKFALSRIIIPYDEMIIYDPVLKKHPWMVPFMVVRRWFRLIFCGRVKTELRYALKYARNVSKEQSDAAEKFFLSIGL